MLDLELQAASQRIEDMIEGAIAALPNIAIAVVLFLILFFVARLVKAIIVRGNRRTGRAENLGLVLGRLTQWFIVAWGALLALSIVIPTFQAGDLVQLLGIGSVAIGFAFRDILQNFLAGILILVTQPFRIGDQIIVGSYEGTVEDIHTRATFLRTYDGRRVVIPNADLFTDSVTVNTAFDTRRMQYDVGVSYDADLDRAKRLIVEAMSSIDGILADPAPDALVVDLGDSAVIVRARWWIHPPRRADALNLQDEVISRIATSLTAHGIDMPYPTQQILLEDTRDRRSA
jgi:small conductance mechanosensitive channel